MTEHNNQDKPLLPCDEIGGCKLSTFNHKNDWAVTCDTCFAVGPCEKTEAKSIAAWNRRTSLTEQSQERDWGMSPALEAMRKQSDELTERLRKQLDEMPIANDMYKNPQNLYTSEKYVKENEISIHEPAQWQARAGTGDWLNIAAHSVQTYEQINGFEVRALYVAPLGAQAIRRECIAAIHGFIDSHKKDTGECDYSCDIILGMEAAQEAIQALIDKTGEAE